MPDTSVSRSVRSVLAALAAGALLSTIGPAPAAAQGYGASVAVEGDQVFVAEPLTERRAGTIYVYEREADGSWGEAARIRSAGAEPGDHFGRALAVGENTLWTGATVEDSTTGAAYVFERDADGGWSQMARFQPEDLDVDEAFGRRAALDGDFALVAAWGHRSGRGAVYVYRRDPETGAWSRYDKLMADDAAEEDWFGGALAIRGDLALVGAPRKGSDVGAVYVFRHDPADGGWRQTAKLTVDGVGQNARFGSAIALRGDRALIGAPGHGSFAGAVFGFTWSEEEGAWKSTSRLLPFDGRAGVRFGTALAWSGEELWVGAPGGDRGGQVYRLRPSGEDDGWRGATRLSPADVERGDDFGSVLAVGGDVAVAGLTGDDYGAGTAMILEPAADGRWASAGKVFSELENYAAVTGGSVACGEKGTADAFPCSGVRLMSFLPLAEIGGSRGIEMSDVWGWTDPETGREYALAGRMDGTAFVDVTDPENPVYLGSLPMTEGARANSWRDIKVYRDHAYVVADNAGNHGVQVFDLTKLRDVEDPPVTFEEDAHYDRVNSVHNIVIDPESGFAFAVGSSGGGETCGGGLHMIDIRQPENPTFAGCFADTRTGREGSGYTHDAQCVTYRGPDRDYRGREICVGANETALSIADVTDKSSPTAISVATYPRTGYTHQGWFGPEQRYFYLDDELDELQGKVERTRTLVWDLTDLDDPIMVAEFMGSTAASDHNLYVVGDRIFQSNYVTGLRVLDASDPEGLEEIGYFDTVPYGENEPGFGGSWSNYPFFESGTIVVTSGSEGLFVLRPEEGVGASETALEDAGPVRGASPPPVSSGRDEAGRATASGASAGSTADERPSDSDSR